MNVWPVTLAYAAIFARKRRLALRYLDAERAANAGDAGAHSPEGSTIVQAIRSGDPRLAETLAHNVVELPRAAFVWLVDDDDPAAEATCVALAARFAERDVRIVRCPPAGVHENPKLAKLALAETHVRTDVVTVVDDDTMLTARGYRALLDALARYDLATGLPSYVSAPDLPSTLVAQFVNDNAVSTYLSACASAPPITINGMCYALRVRTLGRIGGFAAYVRWLPDDLAIARAVTARGGTIYQTPYPHRIRTTVRDVAHYVSLMHRWYLFAFFVLEDVAPARRAAIVRDYAVGPLLLWIVLAEAARSRTRANLLAATVLLAVRSHAHADLQRRAFGTSRHRPLFSIASELAEPLHAMHAAARKTIRWRSRRIAVRAADDFTVIAADA